MGDSKGRDQHHDQQPIRNFVRNNRKIVSLAAIVLLAGAVIVPYASASTKTTHNQFGQETNSPVKPVTVNPEEKDSMPENATNSNQTQVIVNGQSVDVPVNGNYHNVTEDADGRTEIKVESSQHSAGDGNVSNSSSSSVNINVNSQSTSSSSSD